MSFDLVSRSRRFPCVFRPTASLMGTTVTCGSAVGLLLVPSEGRGQLCGADSCHCEALGTTAFSISCLLSLWLSPVSGEVASTVAQTSGESHSKMVGTPRETEVHFYYTDLYFPGHTHILVWNGTRCGPKTMTPTVPVSAYSVELSLLTVPFPCGDQLESCLSILKPHQWVGFKTFTSGKMRLGDIVKYLFMCSRMFLKNQGSMYSVSSSGRCLPLLYNSLYVFTSPKSSCPVIHKHE